MAKEIDPLKWKDLSKEQLRDLWGVETRPEQTTRILELRDRFIELAEGRADTFLKTVEKPSTLQEIPPLAKGILADLDYPEPDEQYTTTEGSIRTYAHAKPSIELVQLALWIGKKAGLLKSGLDLPLRRVWYAFIKATLERGLEGYVYGKGDVIGEPREPEDSDYTEGFADIIKNTNLWYSDFGVRNPSATAQVRTPRLFPPLLVGLEKRSYYDVLQNMASMLGFSIYSAGGQSRFSEQEVLAKQIHSDIFEQYPEYDHLDIFVISDFDPAGIDIAINIGEHQKFYQERFGKTVDTLRLAPLPEHYTRDELEQGLYSVKNPRRRTWNLPEIREQRVFEDEEGEWEIERERGLEVESLPDVPLREILRNPPTDWDDQDYDDIDGGWKALTRMRFILFDELIEQYGISGALFFLVNQRIDPNSWWHERYDTDSLAKDLIDKGEAQTIYAQVRDASYDLGSLRDLVSNYINAYVEADKEIVRKNIEAWLDDTVERITDETHEDYDETFTEDLKERILNEIYYAISRDEEEYYINFPDPYSIEKVENEDGVLYDKTFKITIPDDIVDNIRPIFNWAKCMRLNISAVQKAIQGVGNISSEWDIPEVRACVIGEDGKARFVEVGEVGVVENCEKYKEQIRKLEVEIIELKDKITLKDRELEDCLDKVTELDLKIEDYEKQAKEELTTVSDEEMEAIIKNLQDELEKAKLYQEDLEKQLEEHKDELKEADEDLEECKKKLEKTIKDLEEARKTKDLKAEDLLLQIKALKEELAEAKKKGMPKREKELQIQLDDCQDKLKQCNTEKLVLEYQLGKIRARLPKQKVVIMGKEIDLSKLTEIQEEEAEEVIGWRERKERGLPYQVTAIEDPFAWIDWEVIQKREPRNIEFLGEQLKDIQQRIDWEKDKTKQKIMNEKLNVLRDWLDKVKDPKSKFGDLATAHREMNRIREELRKMFLKL